MMLKKNKEQETDPLNLSKELLKSGGLNIEQIRKKIALLFLSLIGGDPAKKLGRLVEEACSVKELLAVWLTSVILIEIERSKKYELQNIVSNIEIDNTELKNALIEITREFISTQQSP